MGREHLSLLVSASGTRMRIVHEEACPEIGPICAVRDEPPQVHDQRLVLGDLRVTAEYGFARAWSAEAVIGLRAVDTGITYRSLDGELLSLDYENIHHRDETLVGLTDPQLWLRRGFALERLALSVRVGASVPLGATYDDPFYLAARGRPHQHLQLGTGTFNLLAGAEARRELHRPFRGALSAFVQGQLSPHTSPRGYRAGPRAMGGAYLSWKVGFTGPVLRVGALGMAEGPEHWDTTPHPHEGNLGRVDALAEVGAVWSLGSDWLALFTVRVPMLTRSEGHQVSYPAMGEVGAGRLVHVHSGPEPVD